jgi:hypothetical protein
MAAQADLPRTAKQNRGAFRGSVFAPVINASNLLNAAEGVGACERKICLSPIFALNNPVFHLLRTVPREERQARLFFIAFFHRKGSLSQGKKILCAPLKNPSSSNHHSDLTTFRLTSTARTKM